MYTIQARLFKQWSELLLPGRGAAVADLDTEDGSFHGDNTGVKHMGFDRQHLGSFSRRRGSALFAIPRLQPWCGRSREAAAGPFRYF